MRKFRRFAIDYFFGYYTYNEQSPYAIAVINNYYTQTYSFYPFDLEKLTTMSSVLCDLINLRYSERGRVTSGIEPYDKNITATTWGIILPTNSDELYPDDVAKKEFIRRMSCLLGRFTTLPTLFYSYFSSVNIDESETTGATLTDTINATHEERDLFTPTGATANARADGARDGKRNETRTQTSDNVNTHTNAQKRDEIITAFLSTDIVKSFLDTFECLLNYNGETCDYSGDICK